MPTPCLWVRPGAPVRSVDRWSALNCNNLRAFLRDGDIARESERLLRRVHGARRTTPDARKHELLQLPKPLCKCCWAHVREQPATGLWRLHARCSVTSAGTLTLHGTFCLYYTCSSAEQHTHDRDRHCLRTYVVPGIRWAGSPGSEETGKCRIILQLKNQKK